MGDPEKHDPSRVVWLVALTLTMLALLACGSDESVNQAQAGDDVSAADVVAADSAADVSLTDGSLVDATAADSSADTSGADTAADTGPDSTADAGPVDMVVDPTTYCELAVDVFCPFYLRCGRMVADDLQACRDAFVPSCNSRFEPTYVGLANRGLLTLSSAGMAGCAEHLNTVSCAEQVQDLDGPCGDMWVGQSQPGSACGPGIESFVCAPGSTCVLSLNFCGTCQAAAEAGEPCIDGRCTPAASCVDGQCVARPKGGQPCDDSLSCVVATSCTNGVCTGREWVGPGEACGQVANCRYKSNCVGGSCVESALISEPCGGSVGCAAGYCTGSVCTEMIADGASCTAGGQCFSGHCDGTCGPSQTSCLQ